VFIVAQLPLSDARRFAPDRAWRLPAPDWPSPRVFNNPQFVKHFGAATRRRARVDSAWADELAFCQAHRAVGLPELQRRRLGSDDVATSCAFRRLFVDKTTVVARLEIGLISRPRIPTLQTADAHTFVKIAQSALALPVRVPESATNGTTGPLVAQGRRLARLYEFATTARSKRVPGQPNLVEDGLPLLVVELDDDEPFTVPNAATTVDPAKVGGAQAVFMWLRSTAGQVPVWFLARGTASDDHLRSLRLCLLRLHAEQQALDLVLKLLQRGSIPPVPEGDPDGMNGYLNDATRRISRASWGGISQSAILDAFRAAESVTYGDASRELVDRLGGVRPQVASKVEAYWRLQTATRTTNVFNTQGGDVTMTSEQYNISGVTGNVVGKIEAERIDNSFNTIANSSAPPEMKQALTELTEQVKGLLKDAGALTEGTAPASPATPAPPAATAIPPSEAPASPQTTLSPPADVPQPGEGATSPAATTPSAPATPATGGTLDAEEITQYLEQLTQQALSSKPLKDILQLAATKLVDAAKVVVTRAAPITAAVSTVLRLVGIPVPF
jgi:hypothetical protein